MLIYYTPNNSNKYFTVDDAKYEGQVYLSGQLDNNNTECCQIAFKNHLVPTARLELAQPKPLPPQDSVSTNFTTSAYYKMTEHLKFYNFLSK